MKMRWILLSSIAAFSAMTTAMAADSASRVHVDPQTHEIGQPKPTAVGSPFMTKRAPIGAFQMRPDGVGAYYPRKAQGVRANLAPLSPIQIQETEERR